MFATLLFDDAERFAIARHYLIRRHADFHRALYAMFTRFTICAARSERASVVMMLMLLLRRYYFTIFLPI